MTRRQKGTGDRDVGYGTPPRDSRFKQGQSGNPKGRPKGAQGVATIVRKEAAAKVNVTEGGRTRAISKAEALIKTLVSRGLKGEARALAQLIQLLERHLPDAAADEAMNQPFSEVELSVIRNRAALLKVIEEAGDDDDQR